MINTSYIAPIAYRTGRHVQLDTAAPLSDATRARFERAVSRAVLAPSGGRDALRSAVASAVAEMREMGSDTAAIEAFLCNAIEEASMHQGSPLSVVCQRPRHLYLTERVLEWVRKRSA